MAQPIRAVIATVLRREKKRQRPLLSIQRDWRRLVGGKLAAHTKPVRLQRGQLVIHAEHPGDSFMLRYEQPQLLRRLRAKTRGQVNELVIRPGDIKGND
jgi:hypothetical protein